MLVLVVDACTAQNRPHDNHFVKGAPYQGLKPNSLSILYGPTKVVT